MKGDDEKVDANEHEDVNLALNLAVDIWRTKGADSQAFLAAKSEAYAQVLRAILNEEVTNPAQLAWNALFLETNLQAAEAAEALVHGKSYVNQSNAGAASTSAS